MLPVFQPLVVDVMLTVLLLSVPPLPYGEVNAARFSAVRVGALLPIVLILVPPFTQRRGQMLPVFQPFVLAL